MRNPHNEKLHNLYASPNMIRVIKLKRVRWADHVARMGETRNAYSILVGKPEGTRPLGRPRRRWESIIRTGLREKVWECVNWIHRAQDKGQGGLF
jgi:hypothetical protein